MFYDMFYEIFFTLVFLTGTPLSISTKALEMYLKLYWELKGLISK